MARPIPFNSKFTNKHRSVTNEANATVHNFLNMLLINGIALDLSRSRLTNQKKGGPLRDD